MPSRNPPGEDSAARAGLKKLRAGLASGWFKPFRNAGKLLAGRAVRGGLTLAYVALAARALGVSDFGSLMLIQTLALVFGQVAAIPSWQILLSYATTPYVEGDRHELHKILKHALGLDIVSGAAAALLAFSLMAPAAQLVDVPAVYHEPARLYGLTAPLVALSMAPSGVARLLNRFDLLAIHSTVTPALRLAGAAILLATGGGIAAFLVVWAASWFLGQLFIGLAALGELHRRDLLAGIGKGRLVRLRPVRGIWRFSLYAYVNNALNLVQLRFGVLAVGWFLGPAAAGLYRIANQIADVSARPILRLLNPSLYPELSRLRAEDRRRELAIMMRRGLITVAGLSLVILLVLALLGKPLIHLMAGADFEGAYGVLLWLAAGGAVASTAMPIEPLLLSAGHAAKVAVAKAAATLAYLLLLFGLLDTMGLTGAGTAFLGYGIALAIALSWAYHSHRRRAEP